jgi:hypothetical protein
MNTYLIRYHTPAGRECYTSEDAANAIAAIRRFRERRPNISWFCVKTRAGWDQYRVTVGGYVREYQA